MNIWQLINITLFHPIRNALAAFLTHAVLIGMGADHKEGLGMILDKTQYIIQPREHVRIEHIRMTLAGIENYIGEDRHDLFESTRLFKEF